MSWIPGSASAPRDDSSSASTESEYAPASADSPGFVGAYIWGGQLAAGRTGLERFHASVARVLDAGFDTVRFKIGVNEDRDYELAPDPCAGTRTLACYADVMFADRVWDRPEIKRIILTTVDWSCFEYRRSNGNGCLVDAQLMENAAAIRAEYAALLRVLHRRFAGRPIDFILTNWEGDNFAYCGNAWFFALNHQGFATRCRATWPRGQTNAQRVTAFLHWVDLKAEAVGAFKAAHPDFHVEVAPEFSTFALFKAECPKSHACDPRTDTVLDAIAAAGGRPLCSWSSYDSEGPPGGAYLAAVRTILKACKSLVIGEAGYDLARVPASRAAHLFKAMDEIRREPGVRGVVPWHAFDAPGSPTRYGFWTADGRPQVLDLLGPLRPRER